MSLTKSILDGNRLALARLLTQIENNTKEGREELNRLFPHAGNAHLIGVTGAPGTGKSTLVNQLARYYREPRDGVPACNVGIVAVDPSSPFSGGAILGDRVRMRDLSGDPGVFIRSMASRGSLGGLATTTASIVLALDAASFDIILIETVGAGQAEIEIAHLAHTTLVVEAPGMGDDIQAIKAGIMEIADILVINKADRPGVENTERALRSSLQLAHPTLRTRRKFKFEDHHTDSYADDRAEKLNESEQVWVPPIIRTISTEGAGIQELGSEIEKHRKYLKDTGELLNREKARLVSELDALIKETLVNRWRQNISEQKYKETVDQLIMRKLSPWQAVKELLDGIDYSMNEHGDVVD